MFTSLRNACRVSKNSQRLTRAPTRGPVQSGGSAPIRGRARGTVQPPHRSVCVPAGGSLDANSTKLRWELGKVSLAREEQEF